MDFDGDLLYAVSDAGGGNYLYAGNSSALAESIDAELDRTFQAAVGHRMQRATATWSSGQTDEAVRVLERAKRDLAQVSAHLDDPALEALDASLARQVTSFRQTPQDSWGART